MDDRGTTTLSIEIDPRVMSELEYLTHCTSCGREIGTNHWEPQLASLCAECKAQIQQADTAWKKRKQKT